ncbi:hypothetical protein SteCoe_5330 [Stentor coeruleus]|uniref:Uncharacterized protein n=1 Tax=Stentor coeruleus TaxID=5963 RepID=A0A1R2CSR7_9CILI|nr:hypothetical protein SteCoe_5330 [Stentor coeruleus]
MKRHCNSCCFSKAKQLTIESSYSKILTTNDSFSVSKDDRLTPNISNTKIWLSKPKSSEEINKNRSLKMHQAISCKPEPISGSVENGLNIFKTLAEVCQKYDIFFNLPETIIIGYGFSSPVLLYTNEKGMLRLQKNISNAHIKIILDLFEKHRTRNSYKCLGPLAIKREPNSKYNRIIMKQCEIVLEWKNSYNIDVIIQRFILSKGTKASKLRITMGKESKIYKIVNKTTLDIANNNTFLNTKLPNTITIHKKNTKKKTIINLDHFQKRSVFINSKDVIHAISWYNSTDTSKIKDKSQLKLDLKDQNDSFSRINNDKSPSKTSINIRNLEIPSQKKIIVSLNDYFESCKGNLPSKTIEELKKDLKNCKFDNCQLDINSEELIYTNFYRRKANNLFNINTQDSTKTDIFEIKTSKGHTKALEMIQELKKIINSSLKNRRVSKIVCDFIEDENHILYFMKIDTIEYTNLDTSPIKPVQFSSFSSCPGKYCNIDPKDSHINKLYKSQKRTILKKNLLENLKDQDLKGNEMLDPRLYESVQVCENCFEVYRQNMAGLKKQAHRMPLRNFDKKEAQSILKDINPSTAAETVLPIDKRSQSLGIMDCNKVSLSFLSRNCKKYSGFRRKKGIVYQYIVE